MAEEGGLTGEVRFDLVGEGWATRPSGGAGGSDGLVVEQFLAPV